MRVFEGLSHSGAGQVQSKKCVEEVLHFAHEENLFVMADEVNSVATCRLCIVCSSMDVRKNKNQKKHCQSLL